MPLWVILLSPLILSDKITKTGALSAVLGFIGILIVTRPEFGKLDIGVLSAASAAIGFALAALFTRRLMQDQNIFSVLFYLTILQAIFGVICAGFDLDITLPSAETTPWIVLIGCAGLLAHLCLTKALSLSPASQVMPIDFARLPIIAVIGVLFYNEPIDISVIFGAAVIMFANYLNLSRA